MSPVRFNTYIEKSSGLEYRFIGYGEMLFDETETQPSGRKDVCIFAPVTSGFTLAEHRERKPDHTVYLIADLVDFPSLFREGE